jgi:hypothetical protein
MQARVERISISDVTGLAWRSRLEDALDERACALIVLDGSAAIWERLPDDLVRSIAAVTIAVVRNGGSEPPVAAAACDLCAIVDGVGGARWQWHGGASELDGWIDAVAMRVDSSPLAATVLARTLRVTESASGTDGLLVESLAYSVLQAGPEHQRWLTKRISPTSNPRSWIKPAS